MCLIHLFILILWLTDQLLKLNMELGKVKEELELASEERDQLQVQFHLK